MMLRVMMMMVMMMMMMIIVMMMMMGKMMIIMTMMTIYGDARFVSVQMNKIFHRFSNSFKTTVRLVNYRRLS